jgi:hypothetical protein
MIPPKIAELIRFFKTFGISLMLIIGFIGQSYATNQTVSPVSGDNTKNINDAIIRAVPNTPTIPSTSGGFVTLESGVYSVNGVIQMRPGVVLVGSGIDATQLIGSGNPHAIVTFGNYSLATQGGLRDLTVSGIGKTNNDTGVLISNSLPATVGDPRLPIFIERCKIINCGVGVWVQNRWSEINKCHITDCRKGIWGNFMLNSSDAMHAVNCQFWACDTGIRCNGHYNEIIGCQFGAFSGFGIILEGGWTNQVIDCAFETPAAGITVSSAIGIDVRSPGNSIINPYFNMAVVGQQRIHYDPADLQNKTTAIGCNYLNARPPLGDLANDTNHFASNTTVSGFLTSSTMGINASPAGLQQSNSNLCINQQTVDNSGTGYIALSSNNHKRFIMGMINAESGDNGADFSIWRYNDAGFLGEPLRINRATGDILLNGKVSIGGGANISRYLSNSKPWLPGTIFNKTSLSTSISVPNAAVGDPVTVGLSSLTIGGLLLTGSVSVPGTVIVTLTNLSGTTQTIYSGTLRVGVWQH